MTHQVFHPVILYPEGIKPVLLDLSGEDAAAEFGKHPYSIGRYNEKRGIYTSEQYCTSDGPRCIHLGIDLGAPAGTPVHAPCEGEVAFVGYNAAHLDYGYCLVTKHAVDGRTLYFLFGHLASDVLVLSKPGRSFTAGSVLAHLGAEGENGHWPPHLHFQLSYRVPVTHDLPGVCTQKDRDAMLHEFPDPRLVLGAIY